MSLLTNVITFSWSLFKYIFFVFYPWHCGDLCVYENRFTEPCSNRKVVRALCYKPAGCNLCSDTTHSCVWGMQLTAVFVGCHPRESPLDHMSEMWPVPRQNKLLICWLADSVTTQQLKWHVGVRKLILFFGFSPSSR